MAKKIDPQNPIATICVALEGNLRSIEASYLSSMAISQLNITNGKPFFLLLLVIWVISLLFSSIVNLVWDTYYFIQVHPSIQKLLWFWPEPLAMINGFAVRPAFIIFSEALSSWQGEKRRLRVIVMLFPMMKNSPLVRELTIWIWMEELLSCNLTLFTHTSKWKKEKSSYWYFMTCYSKSYIK